MGKQREERGFTLIEILVAMAISLVVMTGVYQVYVAQQKSYILQEQVAAMQQNLRAGMYFMAREIRMAGYNPDNLANIGINQATVNQIQISYFDDQPGSATSGTTLGVTYRLFDTDADGDSDLVRDDGTGAQQLAQNIDALNFVYLDANGAVIANPSANLASIRSIQITLIARTGRPDPGYRDTTSYANQSGTTIYTPPASAASHRRRVLAREVRCRNIGL